MNRIKLLDRVQNGRIDPIIHTGAFLVPGLVNYADLKAGICKLTKETIDQMLNSIKGIPVVIGHPGEEITQANIKKLQNGVVIDGFFNATSGEFEARFITTTSEAEDLVRKGYSLSVAYNEIKLGPGGLHHAIQYQNEILGGTFTHLALVEARKARYEEAYIDTGIKIFQNSIGEGSILIDKPKQEDKKMKFKFQFPFINSKTQEVDTEKACVLIGDKKVSVKDLVVAYNSRKVEDGVVEVEEDREFEIVNSKGDKEKVTAKQLIEAYNEAPPEKDEDKDAKEKTKKDEEDFVNSLDEEEKKEYAKLDKEEAKNSFKNKKKEMKNGIVNLAENAKIQIQNSKGELVTIGIKDLISSFCAHEEAGRNIGTFTLINSKGKLEASTEFKNGVKNDGSNASGAKKGKGYFSAGKFAKK